MSVGTCVPILIYCGCELLMLTNTISQVFVFLWYQLLNRIRVAVAGKINTDFSYYCWSIFSFVILKRQFSVLDLECKDINFCRFFEKFTNLITILCVSRGFKNLLF